MHFKAFQGLRAIACVLILLSHCNGLLNIPSGGIGAIGVEIFIVLSGFLVEVRFKESCIPAIKQSCLYTKKKLKKFYGLHVLTMLLALAQVFLGWIMETPSLNEVKECALKVIANLLLVQSWIPNSKVYFSLNGVSWYLSTTILMYFAAPILHRCIQKFHSVKSKNFVIAGTFLLQIAIAVKMIGSPYLHAIIYIHPLVRIFDFFTGMMLGAIYKQCEEGFRFVQKGWLEAISLIGLTGIIFLFPKIPEAFSYVTFSAPVTWLLICSFSQQKGICSRIMSSPVPTFIGNISFEIFMIHRLVINYWAYVLWIARNVMGTDISGVVSTVCVFVISISAAQILHIIKTKMKDRAVIGNAEA